MNKLFTKIVGGIIGLTMAIGVGVAIGNNTKMKVAKAGTTYTVLNPGDSIDADANYVLKSQSGHYYTGSYSNNFGAVSDDVSDAVFFKLTGTNSTSGFTAKNVVSNKSLRGSANNTFTEDTSSIANIKIINVTIDKVDYPTAIVNYTSSGNTLNRYLKYNSTSDGLRWYNNSAPDNSTTYPVTFYKVTTTDPTISADASSVTLGDHDKTSQVVSVTYANLTASLTATSGNGGIATASLASAVNSGSGNVNLTITAVAPGSTTVTLASSGASNVVINVVVSELTAYTKVTDASNLTPGSRFVISYEGSSGDGVYAASSLSGTYLTTSSATIVSSTTLYSLNPLEFTLGGANGAWTLKNGSDYYGVSSAASNKLATTTTAPTASDTGYLWTIGFNEGKLEMATQLGGGNIQFNYNSGTNPRFTNYTGAQEATVYMYGILAEGLTASSYSVDLTTAPTSENITLTAKNIAGEVVYSAESDDEAVAGCTVSNNVLTITGAGAGSTTVTAYAKVGGVTKATAEIAVTVVASDRNLSNIAISGQTAATTSMKRRAFFDFDGTVTANYDNSDAEDVTSDVTFSVGGEPIALGDRITLAAGNYTVTVSYTDPVKSVTKTASYTLTVSVWSGELTLNAKYVLANLANNDHPGTFTSTGTGASGVGGVKDQVNYLSTAYPLEVVEGNTYNSYAFKVIDTDNESHSYYLATDDGNHLFRTTTFNNASSWTVSVSEGAYTIANVAYPTRSIQYNYNKGNPRFAAYASSQESVRLVQISNQAAVEGFIEDYLKMNEYTSDETYSEERCETNWTAASGAYANLTADQKALFVGGSYSAAATRFANWATANGHTLNMTTGVLSAKQAFAISISNNSTIIIVLVSVMTISLAGGYFLFKKKKQ